MTFTPVDLAMLPNNLKKTVLTGSLLRMCPTYRVSLWLVQVSVHEELQDYMAIVTGRQGCVTHSCHLWLGIQLVASVYGTTEMNICARVFVVRLDGDMSSVWIVCCHTDGAEENQTKHKEGWMDTWGTHNILME